MGFATLFVGFVALSLGVLVISGITTRRAITRTRIASAISRDRYSTSAVVRMNGAVSQLMRRSRVTLATPADEHRRQPAQATDGSMTGKLLPFERLGQRTPLRPDRTAYRPARETAHHTAHSSPQKPNVRLVSHDGRRLG